MNAGAIILAGGKSSRMGTNKAFLNIEEKPNIERAKEALQPIFKDIIIVTNDPKEYEYLDLPIVSDIYAGKGPLAGIHAGLTASSKQINFVVACDMPFISQTLTLFLIEQMKDYDVVAPKVAGKIHTLFSVFNKSALPVIEKNLKAKRYSILGALDVLNVKIINEEELEHANTDVDLSVAFFNMNTIEDYKQANQLKYKKEI